jgi:uncharacterized cupredoxin-like copper-binding protein
MTRRLALLAPFALAAVLAGCGSSSSSGETSSNAAAAAPQASSGAASSLTLSETEFKITPVAPTVSKTGTITITVNNTGTIDHELAVQTPSGLVKTAPISPGSTATLKVDASKDGRYVFYCPIGHHRAAGMQGVLVVGSAASSAGGASGGTTTSSNPAARSGY